MVVLVLAAVAGRIGTASAGAVRHDHAPHDVDRPAPGDDAAAAPVLVHPFLHRVARLASPGGGRAAGLHPLARGGPAGTAIHPAVVTYLLLAAVFHAALVPHDVLQRERLFVGDVLEAAADAAPPGGVNPWWLTRPRTVGHDAIRTTPAAESLESYTFARRDPNERGTLLLQGLLRDRLPPLEDLVMAGNPGPIGTSSAIFVIAGGLFLLYRGVID